MSARRGGHGRRRGRGGHAGHDDGERWLLTYADMITLLMALFMVLFSITSVNKAKLQVLTKSLQQAFSGHILPGGTAVLQTGSSNDKQQTSPEAPIPAIAPLVAQMTSTGRVKVVTQSDQQQFQSLKARLDAYVRAHGLQNQIQTVIDQRGLVIRLLTDRVLFDSGQAELKPGAYPELSRVAQLLGTTHGNAIQVEGHTDSIPISGAAYPTNWELSTARAARVVRFLASAGVPEQRLGAAGYASLHPIDTNDTAAGRSRNRRVEILLLRSGNGAAAQGGS